MLRVSITPLGCAVCAHCRAASARAPSAHRCAASAQCAASAPYARYDRKPLVLAGARYDGARPETPGARYDEKPREPSGSGGAQAGSERT